MMRARRLLGAVVAPCSSCVFKVTAADALQYPRCYSTAGTVHGMAAARFWGVGNAGRGASPTAGKREGVSF